MTPVQVAASTLQQLYEAATAAGTFKVCQVPLAAVDQTDGYVALYRRAWWHGCSVLLLLFFRSSLQVIPWKSENVPPRICAEPT